MISTNGVITSLNISAGKGTSKAPVCELEIDERGAVGDAHAGRWHRQLSLLGQESIDTFNARTAQNIQPGEFAENITTLGLDLSNVAVLDRFRIGTVELELTQIGKKCHGDDCAIFQTVGQCAMPKEGIFCRVKKGGVIHAGERIDYLPRKLKIRLITMSDRAFAGEYTDRSGPRAQELLETFFSSTRWHWQIERLLLPDDAVLLRKELSRARDEGVDIVFTLGGTGVGQRDITPEAVATVCEKQLPGIMEHIRVKYGAELPQARLSRSIAGVAASTQYYALPGSVRAVEEYLQEIIPTLEHIIYMLHGLDIHG